MYCKYCGQPVSDQAKFCPSCGAPVERTAPGPEPLRTVPQGNPAAERERQQPRGPEIPDPPRKKRHPVRNTFLVLLILLGLFVAFLFFGEEETAWEGEETVVSETESRETGHAHGVQDLGDKVGNLLD